jgi:hypothetical protein
MSIEGLQAILEKDEIVATQRAEDLIVHPAMVDESYRRHVRTYVPFSRQASGGDGHSVPDFEKQVIRGVKDARAVRGYITAEYGHGKTSTALYLWERAREANILAVPPFQLNRLTDLIQATYGWARYEIGRTRPGSAALAEAESTYQTLINRSAETHSKRYDIPLATAVKMIRDKPEILDLNPADYLRFFEDMTRLAQEAGYDGLLILADELQQYIDPQIKAGIKDPVSPFFDVISGLITRQGHLNMGLIVVIPPRELEVLRDQRGDFVHRLLQTSLDLRTVYDQDFPQRLWHNLAKAHDFQDHRDRILTAQTLDALGQIGARDDLSDGPRTVVNTFRRATRLYRERGYPSDHPYTPKSLVDDLLTNNIQYDSSKQIATITKRALDQALVKGRPSYETAIKWAAAFPNEGVPRAVQEAAGLTDAFDDLAQNALGDLIISVGEVRNRGFTLKGLEPGKVETGWLNTTIREFWRNYIETADKTRDRALKGFMDLLQRRVFPDNQWRVVSERQARLTQDAGLILQGAFTSSRPRYPDRTVHVRLLWEDEAVKDANAEGDVLIEIRLKRYLEENEGDRRAHEEPLQIDLDAHTIRLTLNLMGRSTELSPSLEKTISAIVSPFKLTPQLLLNLYEVIEEARDRNAIPKEEAEQLRYGLQPDLLDNSFRQMFNETVGQPVGAAQERLIETALLDMLEALFPDYSPLIIISSWGSSLQKYQNALERLDSSYERQGQVDVEGSKDDIAGLFTLSNTGLDSFARNFPTLIDGISKLPGKGEGVVRFTLHPLEKMIIKWLADSPDRQTVKVGSQTESVHTLPRQTIYDRAYRLGYLDSEIDALIQLMIIRGLLDEDKRLGLLREAVSLAPSADELEAEIVVCLSDIQALQSIFPTDPQLRDWHEIVTKAKEFVNEQLRKKPDDKQLYQRRRGIEQLQRQIDNYVTGKQSALREAAARLFRQAPLSDPKIKERLESSIQGSVEYVSQVNDQLRAHLLRRYVKLEGDTDVLRHQIEKTAAALQHESLSITALVDAAKELKAHEVALEKTDQARQAFAKQYGEYAAWGSLVEDGNKLSEQLNQMGDLVDEQRQAFETLSREIRGHLSANKLDGLPDYPQFRLPLNELSDQVRQIRTNAMSSFTTLQDRYRQTIRDKVEFPLEQLWQPHQLNPLAVDDSYSRLYDDVKDTVRGTMIGKFQERIAESQGSLRDTSQSPLLKSLPADEQAEVERKAIGLKARLQQVDRRLTEIRAMADNRAVIMDFPEEGGGQFETLLKQLREVSDEIREFKPEVDSLSQKLQKLALTAEEQSLLDTMQRSSGTIDLGDIRQATPRMEDDIFWDALKGLQAKRRVSITIARVT